MLLSDIDPALNTNPDTFDMSMFAPNYSLINGRPYDGTADGALPIVSAPGHDVLLRIVNAGVSFIPSGCSACARAWSARAPMRCAIPARPIATRSSPGHGRRDRAPALGSVRGRATTRSTTRPPPLQRHPAGYGGMLTTIDATGTWTTSCAGPVASRVNAPGHHDRCGGLAFSAYVTPCAAAPATTVTAAEYFIDAVGARRIGHGASAGPNPLAGTITQARPAEPRPTAGTRSTCTAATRPAPGARSRATRSSSLGSARRSKR